MEEVTNSQGPSCSGKPNQLPKNQSKKAAASHSGQQQTNVRKIPCPFCKESKGQSMEHLYGTDSKVASRPSACQAWRDQSLEDRAAFVEKVRGCALCLDWTGNHQAFNCSSQIMGKPYGPCKVDGCGKKHHRSLHGAHNVYVNNKNTVVPKKVRRNKPNKSTRPESAVLKEDAAENENYKQPATEDELEVQDREGMHTMFLVEEVVVQGASQAMPALAFHDNGSNVTMIRRELAEKLGL